ncbi:aminotransferase class V-fold PLP-dependent enzyme [Microbaculum marinum]|uniref:Aminotransferase class V-fold PLP-dependent enzyme n=1 Tax=Microbaculum marinum TaxID=1764581 RepID=A0AAW9RYU7_9HYPH
MSDRDLIPSQRHLFDIPRDMVWLNCAYMSPLMNTSVAAGQAGILAKAHPWTLTPPDFFSTSETARTSFGRLINATADDVAIVPSASYGISVAAANCPVSAGQEIVLLEDQFPSNVYSWRRLAEGRGARVRTVTRAEATGANGAVDWTAALADAIGPDTAIVAAPNCLWTDGSLVDLVAVGQATRKHGAALVLDVTQSAGAYPIDVAAVQPDFMVAASYKWLLGPYALGFLYAAPHRQAGRPIEENWIARAGSENFAGLVDYQDTYQRGARRYDMGERSNFHLMPMAVAALETILGWGVDRIARTLGTRNREIVRRAAELGFSTAPEDFRAPHFLGLRYAEGIPDDLLPRLAAAGVHVSVRGDSIRVTPHLYNDAHDVDRFFSALEEALA